MKTKILKPLLFSFAIVLMGVIFVSTSTEAKKIKYKDTLTKKQSKKVSKYIKFNYNADTCQLSVKSFKKSNYFKYKKNKKIKKADKKYFNKHFKILESDTIWIDNKKITNPGVDKNGKASTPYGTKKNISDKKFYEQEETNIGGEAVKKLTPGWHTIKLRIYFNTTKNTNYYSSTHLNKNFMYTGKIFVAESVEFVNYYSDHKKNIFPCRTTNDITYKYIGFRMESNFNAKLNTKAVFKVDADHFIKGAGKKNGFTSDAECLKFLQSNFKEDIILEKSFDMKPYDNGKIYIVDATDYSIFETIKESKRSIVGTLIAPHIFETMTLL